MGREWRPRIKEGQVSIRRHGKLFVIVCRNLREADIVQSFLIKALSKARTIN